MSFAIECARFTPGEADTFRKSMATFKFTGSVSAVKTKVIQGMVDRGYEPAFAEKTFSQFEYPAATAFRKPVAEPSVAITVAMGAAIFLPKQRQRHALALQFSSNHRPIGLAQTLGRTAHPPE